MISVQTALEIVRSIKKKNFEQKRPLLECLNLLSAEDILAPIDVPSFDNSAMDGYVCRYEDIQNNTIQLSTNEIPAGISNLPQLTKNTAFRIFTGAPIPENADTVIPQEIVLILDGHISFLKDIQQFSHIRRKGSQTKKGAIVLTKGTILTAEYIGFLATLGIVELFVYRKPSVGIIITGKELVQLGNNIDSYQIFESNSVFLISALKTLDITPNFVVKVDDDKEQLYSIVNERITTVDLLLFTGGISVGDYDFVRPVLDTLGVEAHIYKIKQKPGKPLYVGTYKNTVVFAMPGNPSAVVMCFHIYVKFFISLCMGKFPIIKKNYGILINEYTKKSGLTHFVKARVQNQKIEILSNQLSYQMDSYSAANAFAVLPEHQEHFQIGEKVEVIYFSV